MQTALRPAERSLVQVLRFGATLLVPRTAGLTGHGDDYVIRLDDGGELAARTVIIAAGVSYRQPDAAGLDRFEGTAAQPDRRLGASFRG